MEDGSIISKFPEIASGIDYLISHFSQKVHQRLRIKKGFVRSVEYSVQMGARLLQDREAIKVICTVFCSRLNTVFKPAEEVGVYP